jgi:hypothetical protein
MSTRDSDGDADGADAQLAPIHVTALLIASVGAMSNALDALGFAEDDDRIVEQDGRFGFVTWSHEHDCDDMFALIAELSSSGETWEIQFQADLAPDRMLSHTLSRHRSIVAHEQQVVPHSGDAAGSKGPELPVQDLDTSQGKNDFQRAMRGVMSIGVETGPRIGMQEGPLFDWRYELVQVDPMPRATRQNGSRPSSGGDPNVAYEFTAYRDYGRRLGHRVVRRARAE